MYFFSATDISGWIAKTSFFDFTAMDCLMFNDMLFFENQMCEIIDNLEDNLFPSSVPEIHHRLFIIFVQKGGKDEYDTPVNTV